MCLLISVSFTLGFLLPCTSPSPPLPVSVCLSVYLCSLTPRFHPVPLYLCTSVLSSLCLHFFLVLLLRHCGTLGIHAGLSLCFSRPSVCRPVCLSTVFRATSTVSGGSLPSVRLPDFCGSSRSPSSIPRRHPRTFRDGLRPNPLWSDGSETVKTSPSIPTRLQSTGGPSGGRVVVGVVLLPSIATNPGRVPGPHDSCGVRNRGELEFGT